MTQVPSVGRIVHYVSYGTPNGEHAMCCRAAIITEVPHYLSTEPLDGCPNGTNVVTQASLAVFNPEGLFLKLGATQAGTCALEADQGGTWHWPEITINIDIKSKEG